MIAVVANLIVFMALMALADGVVHYAGTLVGADGWSLELGLAYLFYPVAYLIGVNGDPRETFAVARLLGVKIVINDFIAYQRLGDVLRQGILSVCRSKKRKILAFFPEKARSEKAKPQKRENSRKANARYITSMLCICHSLILARSIYNIYISAC